MAANIWLARWSEMDRKDQRSDYSLNLYLILVIAAVLASFIRCCVCYKVRNTVAAGICLFWFLLDDINY